MNILKLFKVCVIFVLITSFAGCAAFQRKDVSEVELAGEDFAATTLPVTARLRFSDLPVPAGFKLLQDKSFVFQTENTRVALLKYSGRAKIHDLIEFYKSQMLFFNWELLNVVQYEKSILNFVRSDQTCIVTIESRGMRKVITLSVAPKAKGSIEAEPGMQVQKGSIYGK